MLDIQLKTVRVPALGRGTRQNYVRMHRVWLAGKLVYESLFHHLCTRVAHYLRAGGDVQHVEDAAFGQAPELSGLEPEEESFTELLQRVTSMADELCYAGGDGTQPRDTVALYGAELSETLWAYAEGGVAKYHLDRANGRCSLQEMLGYDVAVEETQLKARAAQFQELLSTQEREKNAADTGGGVARRRRS